MPYTDPTPKRKRGRPKGSRNKVSVLPKTRLFTGAVSPGVGDDFRHSDISTIISRQFSMLDLAQQAVRNWMVAASATQEGLHVGEGDISKLEKLSNAIVRAVDGLKKSSDLADEMSKRMSPEQLLEAACQKIEAQDLPTLNYFLKRLRAYRDRLEAQAPAVTVASAADRATDAIASLGDE